jgi:hypothetical protein
MPIPITVAFVLLIALGFRTPSWSLVIVVPLMAVVLVPLMMIAVGQVLGLIIRGAWLTVMGFVLVITFMARRLQGPPREIGQGRDGSASPPA